MRPRLEQKHGGPQLGPKLHTRARQLQLPQTAEAKPADLTPASPALRKTKELGDSLQEGDGQAERMGPELSGVSILLRERSAQTPAYSDFRTEGRDSIGLRPGKGTSLLPVFNLNLSSVCTSRWDSDPVSELPSLSSSLYPQALFSPHDPVSNS